MSRKKTDRALTGTLTSQYPNNQKNNLLYQESYGEEAKKFFADMLLASGEKLRESEKQVESSTAERPHIRTADGRRERGALLINERRKHKETEWRWVEAELPSFAKFARRLGVSVNTMKRWRAVYPSFDEACHMCTDMFEDALVQRGLRGQYDPKMVEFVGTNWAGLRNRVEITGADGAPLNPPPELRFVSLETLDAAQAMLMEAKRKLLEAPNEKTVY